VKLSYKDMTVALIDSDPLSRELLRSYLIDIGVGNVTEFDFVEAAWEALDQGNVHAVVMDWKLRGFNGAGLYNRIRRHQSISLLPVVVATASIDETDFSLLGEYPCTVLVPKPLNRQEFASKFQAVCQEHLVYQSQSEMIQNLLSAIRHGDEDPERIIQTLWKKLSNPIPVCLMAARLLRERKKYDAAERLLRKLLELNYRMIPITAELGKVLFQQGRLRDAVRVLMHAQNFSPKNIERLLLIGEIHLRSSDPERARAFFNDALEIDPDEAKAKSGQIICQNFTDYIRAGGSGTRLPTTFASALNIIAISLVHKHRHNDGIKQYESALLFVQSQQDIAKLTINRGLAFLRWGKYGRAIESFQNTLQVDKRLSEKANRLISFAQGKLRAKNAPSPLDETESISDVSDEDIVIAEANEEGGDTTETIIGEGHASSKEHEADVNDAPTHKAA
jgi:tetratricopeptide (TPR) repeat protein